MTTYNPKVSIVIPAYKAANYLAEAIDSALAQTYDNIEVIVVNDGSPDDGATEAVAHAYGSKIIYVAKENGGSSSALNEGIRRMTGEWFSWLSHDDLYYPNKVQEEIDAIHRLLKNGLPQDQLYKHLFFGTADLIDAHGRVIRKEKNKTIQATDRKINCASGTLNLVAIPTQDGFHGCSCLVHRDAFAEVGLFDESLRLLNDMDLWFRFYTSGYTVHFVPKVLVCGRVHASQVSRSIGFSYHNAEQDMFWNRSLNWLKENHPHNYDVFYLFGKTALLKTRYVEGRAAFRVAAALRPSESAELFLRQGVYMLFSAAKECAKKIYLRVCS